MGALSGTSVPSAAALVLRCSFPERGHQETHRADRERLCGACPVIAECDRYAQGVDVLFGFWADASAGEHKRRRRDIAA